MKTFTGVIGNGSDQPSVYVLQRQYIVGGQDFRSADPGVDANTGRREVSFTLTNEAGDRFYEYTSKNVNHAMAVVMNDQIKEVANIENPIRDSGRITGAFSQDEVIALSKLLSTGALPASLAPLERRQVGASLGADSIQKGVTAAVVGVALVMIFMFIYYRWSGVDHFDARFRIGQQSAQSQFGQSVGKFRLATRLHQVRQVHPGIPKTRLGGYGSPVIIFRPGVVASLVAQIRGGEKGSIILGIQREQLIVRALRRDLLCVKVIPDTEAASVIDSGRKSIGTLPVYEPGRFNAARISPPPPDAGSTPQAAQDEVAHQFPQVTAYGVHLRHEIFGIGFLRIPRPTLAAGMRKFLRCLLKQGRRQPQRFAIADSALP